MSAACSTSRRGWPPGVNQWLHVAAGACPAPPALTPLFGPRAGADAPPAS